MWRRLEAIHAVTYFAPQSIEALKSVGLRGFWMTYFAARAAPMGAVPAAVVEATFYNFHPSLVRRAIPDAWSFASPTTVLDARCAGAASALRDATGGGADVAARAALPLLERATADLCIDGRTLAAANAALPAPDDVVAAAWQHLTTVREHRGDGHVAALVCHGLTGLEAHLTLVGSGSIPRPVLQGARGFSDEEWEAAAAALRARGYLDDDGTLTESGTAMREELESQTDELALEPWSRLGDDGCEALLEALAPIAKGLTASGVVPAINPIGTPID
jgi:hypothetical protein